MVLKHGAQIASSIFPYIGQTVCVECISIFLVILYLVYLIHCPQNGFPENDMTNKNILAYTFDQSQQ